ncbi:MAG: beta-N-acetylhexosaminidase [Planctomycetota bacterium]|jgi:hexosaminidase
MKNTISISLATIALAGCTVTDPHNAVNDKENVAAMGLIPAPMRVELQSGKCLIGPRTRVVVGTDMAGAAVVARHLNQWLWRATGVASAGYVAEETMIVLMGGAEPGREADQYGAEGYRLEVTPGRIVIRASQAAGLFYGFQTLRQMLPAEAELPAKDYRSWLVPAVVVHDQPRFQWRGMHLDVGRHFFPTDEIKRFLDLLALHKFNTFHWHLTEDQGWRIEIKKWPKLTEVGAWRKESPKKGARKEGDGKPYGGYYTQEQVRDLVAYARDRFITIVPEIEMPGHAQAAIAAYPQLGNTEERLEVGTRWGASPNVLNVNDETFAFLEDVLTEVIGLFPGEFVHIGGDECSKKQWKASQVAQRRMQEEGLANEQELQSWFIRRIESFLNQKGRRLIGWDEIQEGGLAPGATMMVWRSWDYGIKAVQQGHDIVMSPTTHCYFDHYQANPEHEPEAIGGRLPLEKVYAFEPVPKELTEAEAKHVLGAQGNLWTEYIWDWDKLMYMAFPRTCAMAETTWSPAAGKDYEDFLARWRIHARRLDVLGVNYRTVTAGPGETDG